VPPTLPQVVCKHEFILLSPYGQSIASPAAAWQLRCHLVFLINECSAVFIKSKQCVHNAVAAAAGTLKVEGYAGGFDLRKKFIRLPRKLPDKL
jgi:hypothetical protein